MPPPPIPLFPQKGYNDNSNNNNNNNNNKKKRKIEAIPQYIQI